MQLATISTPAPRTIGRVHRRPKRVDLPGRTLYEQRMAEAMRAHDACETRAVAQLADELLAFLRQAEQTLSPIIGQKSVSAIYKRSVYLNRNKHPWLTAAYGEIVQAEVVHQLKTVVANQTFVQAKAAVNDLLSMFKHLLQGLIGPNLTQRLLAHEPALA